MAEGTQTAPAPAAAPALPNDSGLTDKLVNTGRADYQILPGKDGVLLKDQKNSLTVPRALADKLRRANPCLKRLQDIFPDAVDTAALKKENDVLKLKASALEGLLAKLDADKADLNARAQAHHDKVEADLAAARAAQKAAEDKLAADPAPEEVAGLQAQVADLQARLKEFLDAGSKKDLDALQEKHADAVPAAA